MNENIPKINPGVSDIEAGAIKLPQIKPDSVLKHRELRDKLTFMKKLKFNRLGFRKLGKETLVFLGAFVFLILLIGLLFFRVYTKANNVKVAAFKLREASKAQNLPLLKQELANTKKATIELKQAYRAVIWTKYIPVLGKYVRDGQHAINAGQYSLEAGEYVVAALEPYADIIGFSGGEHAASGAENAQDRLDFIVKTIPDIIPKMDGIIEKVKLTQGEINQIDPERYPEEFAGKKVRENIESGFELFNLTANLIENSKPLMEAAPYLMGVDSERTYMIIFQNDKELRPTGGFITAYSIGKVRNAKFEEVLSSDIYNLDELYTPSVKTPQPIIDYIKGPYILSPKLRLRDMNWSPDFEESMNLFTKEAEKAGIEDIDGVIAVDTQTLVNILDVIGPIGVSGYGEFSTKIIPECNCPQVVYELESFADIEGPIVWSENEPGKIVFAPANYDNRKKIIGPLMNSVLANTLGQPSEKLPSLFEAFIESLTEKHILLYMFEETAQNAVVTFGIAGKITPYEGDYLHINDANLGGRKSNLYVTQDVIQTINIKNDGTVEKTVEITYKNPQKHDGWLNSVLPNWVRIYVPEGSELVTSTGFEKKAEPYSDLGKTVFAGFFQLRPLGVSKVSVTYKLPFKVDGKYNLLIQKQSGKDKPLYTVIVNKKREEFQLKTDKELFINI